MSAYDIDLDKNPANYQPLTPLTFLARSASVYPDQAAIIHGRYDMVCPPVSAFDLCEHWLEADLVVVPDAGHSAFEAGTRSELVGAMERLKSRL